MDQLSESNYPLVYCCACANRNGAAVELNTAEKQKYTHRDRILYYSRDLISSPFRFNDDNKTYVASPR